MCEAGTATQAEAGLFLDMSQSHQIRSLSATGRAGAESPQAARADTDNVTQAADWEVRPVFLDKPKPHGFRLARNWVAFLRNSHVSLHWQFLQIIPE